LLTESIPSSIGGTPGFIADMLANELAVRSAQDSSNRCTQPWHVIVFPDSNMSNAAICHLYRSSEATARFPVATSLRPTQQITRPQHLQDPHDQKVMYPQQHRQGIQQAAPIQYSPYNNGGPQTFVSHYNFCRNEQSMHTYNNNSTNNGMGGHGRAGQSLPPSQESQFTTPMLESDGFARGSASANLPPPQQHCHPQGPHQGNLQAFGPKNGMAQVNYSGQSDNMMSDLIYGLGTLPQVHQPIFDRYGYVVGEQYNRNNAQVYGDNLYNGDMYGFGMGDAFGSSQSMPLQEPQQAQGPQTKEDPQLVADARSFVSFVTSAMDLDGDSEEKHEQDDDDGDHQDASCSEEEKNQDGDEGIAVGRTSSGGSDSSGSEQESPRKLEAPVPPQQSPFPIRPETPPPEVLLASEKEPWRFTDNTGTNLCDYCGRDGHEADACLKWDPVHYDKPVCTACNNDQHSLDECPRFRAMPTPQRQALLLDKGAGRPGVRSQYHPWTSYVHRGGDGASRGANLPLTRRFLFSLSVNPQRSEKVQKFWSVWDYNRGVPSKFRDPRAEALAGDPAAPVDERFMDGKHELGWKIERAISGVDGES
jgi:hypothetical protein